MAEHMIAPDLLARLRAVDTPTICNAIEVAQGARGFANFTRGTMLCSAPEDPPVVGFARTARIAGAAPPAEDRETIRARRLDYFRAMAAGPRPAVAVVEDLDDPCVGAWWGEVHTAVHKGLGLAGAITNGVMRDLGDLEPGFPVIAGSVGPSHAFVHVRAIGTPVAVFGMQVAEGDLIHADRHGALVIPLDVVPRLNAAIDTLFAGERIVLDAARAPDFDIDTLLDAWARFEKART